MRNCLFGQNSSENSPSGYFMDMPESNDKPIYHSGQDFVCPQCGIHSIVREEEIIEGLFDVVGKRHVCSMCGWQIPEDRIAISATASAQQRHSNDAAALDALFGDKSTSDSKPILSDTDTVRFCKNCRHYLHTPFMSRCLLHSHEVEPLGICEQFSLPSNA